MFVYNHTETIEYVKKNDLFFQKNANVKDT